MTAQDEIARLRRKVEDLIAERAPIGRAEQAAGERLNALAAQVRERPLTAVLLAAGLGYVMARLTRRRA
ncbi:MAG TPA: CsbD family protein [Acetobacteraceae bacterium]